MDLKPISKSEQAAFGGGILNVSTNAGSNARTSPDFPAQQKQFAGRSRQIKVSIGLMQPECRLLFW